MIHDMTRKAQHNDPFAMAYVLSYYGYKERQPDPVKKYIAEHGLTYLPDNTPDAPPEPSKPEKGISGRVKEIMAHIDSWPSVPNSQLNWTNKEKNMALIHGLEIVRGKA